MIGLALVGIAIQQQIQSSKKKKQSPPPKPQIPPQQKPQTQPTQPQQKPQIQQKQNKNLREKFKSKFNSSPQKKTSIPQSKLESYYKSSTYDKIISGYYQKLKQRKELSLKTLMSSSRSSKPVSLSSLTKILESNISTISVKLLIDTNIINVPISYVMNLSEVFDILKMTPIYVFNLNLPFSIYEPLSKTLDKYIQIELFDKNNNRIFINKYYIVDVKSEGYSENQFKVTLYQFEDKYIEMLNDNNFYLFENKTIDEIQEFIQRKYNMKLNISDDTKNQHLTITKYSNVNQVEFLRILPYYTVNKNGIDVFYKSFIKNNTLYFIHNQINNEITIDKNYLELFSKSELIDNNSVIFVNNINYSFNVLNVFDETLNIKDYNILDKYKSLSKQNYFIFNDFTVNTLPEINEINYMKWIKNNIKKVKVILLDNVVLNNLNIFSKIRISDTTIEFLCIGYVINTNISAFGEVNNSIKIYVV